MNLVTNKIYVANSGGVSVTVINGANNSIATVSTISNPSVIVVNPVTNKIYVANYSSNITVIDGATNSATNLSVGLRAYP